MNAPKQWNWRFLGPAFVIIGSCLWGTETYFRVNLNQIYDSDVLVFIEHFFCLIWCSCVFIFERPKWHGFSRQAWIYVILSGALGSAIGTFFFTESLRHLNTSVANVLLNFQPIVSVAFAALLLRERLHWRFFVWATFALFCGALIVFGDFSLKDLEMNIGLLFIALTALSWGFGTVAGRGTMLEMPLVTAAFLRFLIGFATLFIVIVVEGKITLLKLETVPAHLGTFIGLSLFSGVIPLFFYFKGLAKTPASLGGFCEMTQTIAAVLVTWGVLGDKLSPMQSIGAVLLMYAIYKLNSQAHETVEHPANG